MMQERNAEMYTPDEINVIPEDVCSVVRSVLAQELDKF